MYNLYTGTKGFKMEHDIKESGVLVPLGGATAVMSVVIDGRLHEAITPTITNDVISYTLDFEKSGLYEIYGLLTFANGSVIPTNTLKFVVKDK